MAEQPKSGIAALADRARDMFRRVVEYPDPSVVMADQAAPIPEVLKDPRTYRQFQEGAATGSLGMFGDMGEVFKQGLGDNAKYLPFMFRAPVQAMQVAPTTEGVTQLLTKAGYPFSDTESTAHKTGTFFSPVGAGAITYAFPKALRAMKQTTAADKPSPPVAEQQETFDPSRRKFLKAAGATGVATLLPFAARKTPQRDLPPVTPRLKKGVFDSTPRFDNAMGVRYYTRAELQGELYAWLDKNQKMLKNQHGIEIKIIDDPRTMSGGPEGMEYDLFPEIQSDQPTSFQTKEDLKRVVNTDLMVKGPKGQSERQTDFKVIDLFVKDIQKKLNDPNTPKTKKNKLERIIAGLIDDRNLTQVEKLDLLRQEATLKPLDKQYSADLNYANYVGDDEIKLTRKAGKYNILDLDTFVGSAETVARYILDPAYRKAHTLTDLVWPERALLQDVQQKLVEVRNFLKSPKDSIVLRDVIDESQKKEVIDDFQKMIDERYGGLTGNDTEDLLRILRGEYDNRVKDAVRDYNITPSDVYDFDDVIRHVKYDMKDQSNPIILPSKSVNNDSIVSDIARDTYEAALKAIDEEEKLYKAFYAPDIEDIEDKFAEGGFVEKLKKLGSSVINYADPDIVMADQVDPNITPQTYSDLYKGSIAGTVSIPGEIGAALKPAIPVLPKTGSLAPVRLASEVLQSFPTTEPITQFAVDKGLITRETAESPAYFGGQFLSLVPAGVITGVLPAVSRNIAKAKELLKKVKLPKKIKPNYVYSQEQIDAAELQKKKYINIDGDFPIIGGQAPILDKLTDKPFQYSPENLSNDFGAVHTVVLDVDEALRFFPDRQLNATKTISGRLKPVSTSVYIAKMAEDIANKKPLAPPFLQVDFDSKTNSLVAFSHEGAHRLAALKALGVEKVPINIYKKREYVSRPLGKLSKGPSGDIDTRYLGADNLYSSDSFTQKPGFENRIKLPKADLPKIEQEKIKKLNDYFENEKYEEARIQNLERRKKVEEEIEEKYFEEEPTVEVAQEAINAAKEVVRLIEEGKSFRIDDDLLQRADDRYLADKLLFSPRLKEFAEGGFVEKLKKLGSDIINYPDPNIVMADQAAPVPEVLKDPRTYIEAEKGAITALPGMFGDIGSMFEGVAGYIPYMPTSFRAPVQTLMQLPTTEKIKEFGIEKGLLTREETEGVPFQVGEFFSPVSGAAAVKGAKVLSKFGPQAGKYISQEGLLAAERLMDKAPEVFQPRLNIVPEGPTTTTKIKPLFGKMQGDNIVYFPSDTQSPYANLSLDLQDAVENKVKEYFKNDQNVKIRTNYSNVSPSSYVTVEMFDKGEENIIHQFKLRFSDHDDYHPSQETDLTIRFDEVVEDVEDEGDYIKTIVKVDEFKEKVDEGYQAIIDSFNNVLKATVRPITRHMGVTSYARKLAEGVKRKKGTTAEFVNELKARAKKDQKEVNFNAEIKAMELDLTDTTPISREQFQRKLADNELSIDLTVLGETDAEKAVFGEAMEIEPSSEDLVQFNQISTVGKPAKYTPVIIPIETPKGDYALVRSMLDGRYELQEGLGDYQAASFGAGRKSIKYFPSSEIYSGGDAIPMELYDSYGDAIPVVDATPVVNAKDLQEAKIQATNYFKRAQIINPGELNTIFVQDFALEGVKPQDNRYQTKRREFLVSSPQIKGNFVGSHFGPAQTATQDNILAHMLITDWEGPVKLEDGTVLNPDSFKGIRKTGQATSKIFYVDEVQDDLTMARQQRNTYDNRMDAYKDSYAARQKEVAKMMEDLAPLHDPSTRDFFDNITTEKLSEYVTTHFMRRLTIDRAKEGFRDPISGAGKIEDFFNLPTTLKNDPKPSPVGVLNPLHPMYRIATDPIYKPLRDFLIDLERNQESLKLIKPNPPSKPMTYVENPWAKVSHETALKQALRIAVDEGYDYLMVPNEKMPEIKYGKKEADSLKNLYQKKVPKILKKIAKTYNTEVINAFLDEVPIVKDGRGPIEERTRNVDLGAYVIKLTPELKEAVLKEGVGDTFAQGGVVRKRGIGTLNEIARTMFQRPRGVSGLSSVARNMFQ